MVLNDPPVDPFLFHENPSSQLVLVSLIHHCTETHSYGFKFKTLFFLPPSPLFPVLHFRAPAPAILSPSRSHSSFTLSLGHPIHLFFIKLQRSPRLISCGSWWNREHAGSFPETGRGREGCQRSKVGGWFGLGWWKTEGLSFCHHRIYRKGRFSQLESDFVKQIINRYFDIVFK